MTRGLLTGKLRAVATGVMVTVSVGALVSACTTPRNTLGTNSSPCFKALPVASEAVGDRGTLVGARLESTSSLHRRLHALLAARDPTVKTVCVVAFHGRFRVDQVKLPYGPPPPNGSGIFAVVVVSVPRNALIGTVVLATAPLPLRHVVLRPLHPHRARSRDADRPGHVA